MRNVKADETDRNKMFIYEIAELSECIINKLLELQNKKYSLKEGEIKC